LARGLGDLAAEIGDFPQSFLETRGVESDALAVYV
jgi:hypothetical protein